MLIDAENVAAAHADEVFSRVSTLGTATVRRAYGDFTATALRGWVAALPEAAIEARQVFPNSPGKDAADMALIIDAMDLLHGGRLDGFCLVSSDSDFTRLAIRIREQGLPVWGFGRASAAVAYRNACSTFIPISVGSPAATLTAVPAVVTPTPAERLIRQVLSTSEGWMALGQLGTELRRAKPTFTMKRTGHTTLTSLLRASDLVEMRGAGQTLMVRLKQRKAA